MHVGGPPNWPEHPATQYQWQRPFIIGSIAATVAFGIKPARTDGALRELTDP